jgi:AraC-like DNA-binding protein
MEFNYIDNQDTRGLIKNLFVLQFKEESLPYETIVLPLGLPALVYVFNEQTTIVNDSESTIKDLTLFGQFYGAYDYKINEEGINLGINFHPTALYKILHRDISIFTNTHPLLKEVAPKLRDSIKPVFTNNKNDTSKFKKDIIKFFDSLTLIIDKDVEFIDKAVDFILKKEGLIKINDLLEIVPFSQKSLESKFKKIIGLTPGKYIKMIRFNTLMTKYQSKKIALRDLIHMSNYYDRSHFARNFKVFMKQTPKAFFNKDYPLLQEYLRE